MLPGATLFMVIGRAGVSYVCVAVVTVEPVCSRSDRSVVVVTPSDNNIDAHHKRLQNIIVSETTLTPAF